METIRVSTWIDAPVERCFKLATSIDLHLVSAAITGEKVIGGVTSGLLSAGDTVQWQGRHFGREFTHTSRIDQWRPYSCFREVMVEGHFLRFEHEHHFALMDDGTRMRDEVRFAAPYGSLGKLAARAVLRRHIAWMLKERNAVLRRVAESEEWRKYLEPAAEAVRPFRAQERSRAAGWDHSAVLR